MLNVLRPCCTLVAALALTACGGGGGGESIGDTTPPPRGQLGSRTVPGATISVTAETAIAAGQPASVLITAPDLLAGAALDASVGSSFETASAATVTALTGNRWRAAMTLPNPLTIDTSVLVTVNQADGSVLEAGLGDFVLSP